MDIQDGGTVTLDGFTIRGAERVSWPTQRSSLRNLVVTETGGSGLSQGAALSIRGQ